MIISIIIPVYNVSKYIHRCLNSIIEQTGMDWECILVDDGSPDDSGAICDEYATKDNRFKVVHKINGGVSSARNEGLKVARGRWIVFVDADDTIESNYISTISNILTYDNALDLIVFDMQEILDNGIRLKSHLLHDIAEDTLECIKTISDTSALLLPALKGASYVNPPWNKVYRADIIRNNALQFAKRVRGEDWLFNIQYLQLVKKVAFTRAVLYNYMRNGASAMAKYCPEQFQLWVENYQVRMELISKYHWKVDIKQIHRSLYENTYYFLTEIKEKESKVTKMQKLHKVLYNPLLHECLKTMPSNLRQMRAWVCINCMRLTL